MRPIYFAGEWVCWVADLCAESNLLHADMTNPQPLYRSVDSGAGTDFDVTRDELLISVPDPGLMTVRANDATECHAQT